MCEGSQSLEEDESGAALSCLVSFHHHFYDLQYQSCHPQCIRYLWNKKGAPCLSLLPRYVRLHRSSASSHNTSG